MLSIKTWTVFIDLDGTLIDTSERHYNVYKDILCLLKDASPLPLDEFWKRKRSGQKTTELLSSYSSNLKDRFTNEWLKRIEEIKYLRYDRLVPDALKVLDLLERTAELILVTLRQNKKNLFWELNSLGLTKYFKEVLVGELSLNDKSRLIREYAGKIPKSAKLVLIGDSEADLNVGKQLSILTIAVTYGIRSKGFLNKLRPDFCLENLRQVLTILR